MRHTHTLLGLVAGAAMAACGGDSGGPEKCGAGTKWNEATETCLLDQPCGTGTIFNETTGQCEPENPLTCPPPNTVIGGECVNQPPTADVMESQDPMQPAVFSLPAPGESVTLGGCINPENDAIDEDPFVFQSNGNTLVKVTAQGFGGLAAGFLLTEPAGNLENYLRFGIDLSNSNAERTVYIPSLNQGAFALNVADSRSLFFGEPAGNPDACYFVTVETLSIPAPTAIQAGQTDLQIGNDTQFYSYSATDGDILFTTLEAADSRIVGDYVQVKNDEFFGTAGIRDPGTPAEQFLPGLRSTDDVIFAIDPVYNFALSPVDGAFIIDQPPVAALPTTGNDSQILNDGTTASFLFADVTTESVLDYNITADADIQLLIFDGNGQLVPGGQRLSFDTTDSGLIVANSPGFYYFQVVDRSSAPLGTLTFSGDHSVAPLLDLTVGQQATIPATDGWFLFDRSQSDWITVESAETYDLDVYPYEAGFVDENVTAETSIAFPADFGIIVPETYTSLLRVRNQTTAGTLDIGDRLHTNLGTVDEANPIDIDAQAIAAGETLYYLATVLPGAELDFDATAGFDINILAIDETITETGNPLNLKLPWDNTSWVAFSITKQDGTAGTFDLDILATDPRTWSSVCPGQGGNGTQITLNADPSFTPEDEGVSDTVSFSTFTFDFYGAAQTGFKVSSNGWLTFDTAYAGSAQYNNPSAMPDAGGPNAVIAPYWDDLDSVTVCYEETANELVIQWTGIRWNTTTAVQVEAILADDGSVSFFYGDLHQGDGASAAIGVENAAGDDGIQHTDSVLGPNFVEILSATP